MFCGKCGAEVLDGAKFCDKCGSSVEIAETNVSLTESISINKTKQESISELQKVFVESDEQLIAQIGNGYLVNMLYNNLESCALMLTDKRVYLKGTVYSGSGRTLEKDISEKIVNIDDVTGSGFIFKTPSRLALLLEVAIMIGGIVLSICIEYGNKPIGQAIIGIVFSMIVGAILILPTYFLGKKTKFFIEYAGGKTTIDAKLIGVEDLRDFQKQIYRVKDNIKGK